MARQRRLECAAVAVRQEALLRRGELGGGCEQAGGELRLGASGTVQRPGGSGRLSQAAYAVGDVPLAHGSELLREAVAGGGELLERQPVELVGGVGKQGAVHDIPSRPTPPRVEFGTAAATNSTLRVWRLM